MENPFTVPIKEQYRSICQYTITTVGTDGRKLRSRNWAVGLELVVKNKGEHFLARVKNEQRHTIVSHGEIFKQLKEGEQPIKRILVEGGAGMGKTTLCTSLTKGWANGKLFQKYDVLLLIPLGQKEVALAASLLQLIEALKLEVNSQEMVSYIQGKNGSGVVVIADGWNSLDESERREGSFFHELLFGSLLSLASVVVTSRPTASATLHKGNSVDRFIETCGFNRGSIQDYVKHKFAGDQHGSAYADGLLKRIDDNPALLRMCSVPITCTKVCLLWHTKSSERPFPSRITELCTKIILNILNYKCHEMGVSISSMTDIDDLPKHIQESWWRLCKLAYLTIEKSKIDLTVFDSFQYGIMTFGFVEYSNTDEGSVSVDFVHPTSHECLAALHIVKQLADGQLQNLNDISLACRQAPIFWKYFFGLCDYRSLNDDHGTMIKNALQMISTYHPPKCRLLCSCAFEAQSDTITSEVIKCLSTQIETNTIVQLSDVHNSLDCDAMLYVIENIKSDSKCDGLHINFSGCNLCREQTDRLATILASNSAKLKVKELDLSGNKLPDDQVACLFKKAAASFQSLETLFVRNNQICKKGITAIMKALAKSPSPSLKHLDLSFNPLELEMRSVFKLLCKDVKSGRLKKLNCLSMQKCLTSNAEENTKCLKDFSERILSYYACTVPCPNLRQLIMYGNAFVVADVTDIIMKLRERNIRLMLDGETAVEIMKDSMENKRIVKHTVVHGVFVGPGRSGKNSLMNRLIGEGPSDPDKVIPSTGVLENVIKVEVKKLSKVAKELCLQWRRVKYEHEDLELMMATITSPKAGTDEPDGDTVDSDCEAVAKTLSVDSETFDKQPDVSPSIIAERQTPLESTLSSTEAAASSDKTPEAHAIEGPKLDTANVTIQDDATVSSPSSIVDPLDMFRRATDLQQREDALCEHFESSWMLYLTNTGGQTEFQELLPVLMRGPSVFFITFPLNQKLNDYYTVRYDGCNKSESYEYPSSATLIEDILQTLTTIIFDALARTRTDYKSALKVFFVGTHKDKLKPKLLECQCIDKRLQESEIDIDHTKVITVDDQNLLTTIDKQLRKHRDVKLDDNQTIKIISVDDQNLRDTFDEELRKSKDDDEIKIPRVSVDGQTKKIIIIISVNDQKEAIDKQLRDRVERTSESLNSKRSIVYVDDTKSKLIFAVNNFDKKHTDFYCIQLRLQKEVEECDDFTIDCRFSWLVFSLILRAKHTSDKYMTYGRCFELAKRCGIQDIPDLNKALDFIHNKLGLVRYFQDFRMPLERYQIEEFVVIDPHNLFEVFTQIITNGNPVEKDFEKQVVISKTTYCHTVQGESANLKKGTEFRKWVMDLLVHLKLVAVFKKEGNTLYFFPSVLCRTQPPPEITKSESHVNEPPPLLIGFKGGLCPRGLPGALITHLMTNHDVNKWEFLSMQVYRNQVSFRVRRGVIILKIYCTHVEVKLGLNSEVSDFTEDDKKQTCEEAYYELNKFMNVVNKAYRCPESEDSSNCYCFFGFYCIHSKCQAHPHFAELDLKDRILKCTTYHGEPISLPKKFSLWIPQEQSYQDSDFSKVDSTTNLDQKSLKAVIDEISTLKARYYDLGIYLCVPAHELDRLKEQYGAVNITQAFNEMVQLWLTGDSTRTWQALVKEVDKFNHDLAMKIAGNHRAISSSVPHQASSKDSKDSKLQQRDPGIFDSIVVQEPKPPEGQMKGKDREQISEAMEVKYYDDAQDSSTESDSGSSSEDSQEDTSDDDNFGCVEDEQELSSEISDHEPVVENVQQSSMETISDATTLLQESSEVCQTESTLELQTQNQVENKQEQSGSVFEMDTSHNITVDPFKAESTNTVDLDVVETEIEQVVKKQEETGGNMSHVNDALPSSRGTNTPATQTDEKYSTDSIRSPTSTCSAHDCEAVLYVISNMKGSECDGIEINFNSCNFSVRQASALADMLASKMGKIQVKDLDLSDNSLPDDTLANLFSKAAISFRSLEKLFIRNNGVSQKGISAIMKALSASSSKTLVQLDLSFNPLMLDGLQVLNGAIKSGILTNLAILFMQGCLTSRVSENVNYLCSLAKNLLSRCPHLRRLDLSANDFGKGVTPTLSRVIMQLSKKVDLRLNREYMSEVDKSFVAIMEDSVRRKGTIDHTVVHGVIVGPGRSGKNSLMNRLVGEGPPDPNTMSPSTGVLENVLKIEVKKLCTVAAAVNNLLWKKLDYDEEALELMMVTASSHTTVTVIDQAEIVTISTNEPDDPKKNITSAMILVEEEAEESSIVDVSAYPFEAVEENEILEVNVGSVMHMSSSKELERKKPPPSNVKSSEGPLEIFKRAVKLRRMDALREHLESSWSLYLTNTGGQTEFQDLLPLLVCGPSVFFITFPLHQSLHEHYMVDYQYSDGSHKTYPSSSTLMDEILQTLATIAALDCTGPWTDVNLKPKIFFVGTHKDKLPDDCVNDKIQAIDKQLQEKVRQTSLFKQGSIEFAVGTEKLIYTVNNLAEDDGDFKMIRLGLQKVVVRCEEFTIKCPSTWLIFSLILRAKHKSSQVLSYNECYTIAQRCGISDRTELNDALFFIHTRLGLLRYFCVEKLNKLVVIDPQIMFDTITKVLVETFVSDHAKVNEIEEFQKRGIISQKVIKRISSKRSHLQSQLPFEWILCLLDHLRIAAFFMNKGEKCYFLPSALCHAPEQEIKPSIILPVNHEIPPPLLIAFESGFCPRGIPGALITYLMTNEMKSKIVWKLHSNRVFRNQVSFGVGPCDIILKVLSTHLEVKFDPESEVSELSEMKVTCEETFNQLRQAMRTVTKGYRECNYYFAFNCTRSECEGDLHPARIELDSKKLKCERTNRRSGLPQHYDLWVLQVKNESRPARNQLDMVIDSENNGVSKHLGRIANAMYEWEGRIADELGLSVVDVAEIKLKHPSNLKLQTRAALESWKQKLGDHATYNCLVNAFKCAGYQILADAVKNLLPQTDEVQRDDDNYFDESFTSQPPPTPPPQQPVFPTIATKVLLHQQGKEEEHQVEIETKEVTSFQDFFKRQTSMLSPPSDHETEDDCADCNPLEKVSHEVEKLSESDVENYEDSTSISPALSTSSLSELLQEYNLDEVVGHDCQLEGDAIEEGDGNRQGRVSDEMYNSKRLGQRQGSTPEEMPVTVQPRQMHSTTFEDSALSKEDDIPNIDGATASATQITLESEPWSMSDMESSEDNVPPTALMHSQDSRGAAGPMSPSRKSSLIADDDDEEKDDEFRVFETLVTARSAKAESKFSQQDTLVIREDQPRASPLSHTSSFVHPQFAQLAEHPQQSFIYTPPDSGRGPIGLPAQPHPQEQNHRSGESGEVPHGPEQPSAEGPKMSPEIRMYKHKFSSEILCGALWGVNLFVGTDNGLLLLDRSGHGKVFPLITRRKFSQIEVIESHNILICINGRKNKLRVYYLSWFRNKILKGDDYDSHHNRRGFVSVGDLEHCVHYRVFQHGKMKFLVIGTKTSVEVYAWAVKPYSKFMAFKTFPDLREKPVLVDMIAETANREKVIYASTAGFHAIDMETGSVQNLYIPSHGRGGITPHAIIALPRPGLVELLLCYDDEGVYVNSTGGPIKDTRVQWGDTPSSVALIGDSHVMGWGSKAIEIRAVDNGQLDGVFMHKRTLKLIFLCEKNDKVFFASIRSSSNSRVYFMALNRTIVPQ